MSLLCIYSSCRRRLIRSKFDWRMSACETESERKRTRDHSRANKTQTHCTNSPINSIDFLCYAHFIVCVACLCELLWHSKMFIDSNKEYNQTKRRIYFGNAIIGKARRKNYMYLYTHSFSLIHSIFTFGYTVRVKQESIAEQKRRRRQKQQHLYASGWYRKRKEFTKWISDDF